MGKIITCIQRMIVLIKRNIPLFTQKDISLRYQFFSLRQKNQQIFSADFNDAGKGT